MQRAIAEMTLLGLAGGALGCWVVLYEFSYAAAWGFTGTGEAPVLHKEDLVFEYVHPTQRSYA